MPTQVWPVLLVALLGVVAATVIPWLAAVDPTRPEVMLAEMIRRLERAQDIEAHLTLVGRAGPAVSAQLQYLNFLGDTAARVYFISPPELRGEIFTLHGGALVHYRPGEGREGVIIRWTLSQAQQPILDLRRLLGSLGLEGFRVTAGREELGQGWSALRAALPALTLPGLVADQTPFLSVLTVPSFLAAEPGGQGAAFRETVDPAGWPSAAEPTVLPPPLEGPMRLEVSGSLPAFPEFRRAVAWLDGDEEFPHRVALFGVRGTDEQLLISVAIDRMQFDQGLSLRGILSLPPARRTLWQ
ncbi:MAG: hypothetical protein ACP5G2_00640 [Candidatus Bipolaricaulaceae bacterium]